MKTVKCDEVIRYSDGAFEIRYSENGMEAGAITFPSEPAFEAWLGRAEMMASTDELLVLALIPDFISGRKLYAGSSATFDMSGANPGIAIEAAP